MASLLLTCILVSRFTRSRALPPTHRNTQPRARKWVQGVGEIAPLISPTICAKSHPSSFYSCSVVQGCDLFGPMPTSAFPNGTYQHTLSCTLCILIISFDPAVPGRRRCTPLPQSHLPQYSVWNMASVHLQSTPQATKGPSAILFYRGAQSRARSMRKVW